MANKQSLLQRYQNVVISGLLLVSGLLIIPANVLAAPYGSGSYDDCKYSQGCDASGGPITTTPPDNQGSIILLNDFSEFFTEDGKTLDMGVADVVHFNLTVDGQLEDYTITIKQVGDNFVILTFAPDSFDVTLTIGQSGQYDVNGDGKKDIKVTLNGISDGKANLSFSAVLGNSTVQPSNDDSATVEKVAVPQKGKSWLWMILSILAIVTAIFIFFILWRRRRKKDEEPGIWQSPTPPAT